MSEVNTSASTSTEINEIGVFPLMIEKLMPQSAWTEYTKDLWASGVKGWHGVMMDESARPLGNQIDFYDDQINATKGMFELAVKVRSSGQGIIRDEQKEEEIFNAAFDEFFCQADELFIGVNQLQEAYSSLIINPAARLGDYLIAMGRVNVGSSMSAEAIAELDSGTDVHETNIQKVVKRALTAFDGSIDLVAQAAAIRTVHHKSRFGRLKSTVDAVDKEEYDLISGALRSTLSAVAMKSYELGFNDGVKEQGE